METGWKYEVELTPKASTPASRRYRRHRAGRTQQRLKPSGETVTLAPIGKSAIALENVHYLIFQDLIIDGTSFHTRFKFWNLVGQHRWYRISCV